MSKYVQLSFPQGDDKRYTVTIKDKNLVGINIGGATITSQIRETHDSDVVGTFTCSITDAINGVFTLEIDNATSAALPVSGTKTRFVFDVEIEFNDGTKQKALYGDVVVVREVTR